MAGVVVVTHRRHDLSDEQADVDERRLRCAHPGPQTRPMKVAFEKHFLWKARHGYVSLP
jgi:hypothetical protein